MSIFRQAWPPSATITQTIKTLAADTTGEIVPYNADRKYLAVMVTGTNPATIALGTGTVTIGEGMSLNPPTAVGNQGGGFEMFGLVATNAFSGRSLAGTTLCVWEG
jgi:hypothetical protein